MSTPDLMAEMAECPFCGSMGATVGGIIPWVQCDRCESGGPPRATVEEAIEAWNKRAYRAEIEDARLFRLMFPDEAGRELARKTLEAVKP